MFKRIVIIAVTLAVLAGGMASVRVRSAQAQDPTIPTRTPTPDPSQPTRTDPTATSTDPDNPGNPPTNTPVPGQTGTASPGASATPMGTTQSPGLATGSAMTSTPDGIAPAEVGVTGECDDAPYVEAIKNLVVYAGPGGNYARLATLEIAQTRLILGRAGFADWWQIQVSPDMIGWVDDEDVRVFGNTRLVMLVEPPTINGLTPTPGPAWNPTPPPFPTCAPTPTPSSTSATTPDPTGSAVASSDGAGGDQPTMAAPDAVVADVTRVSNTGAEANTTESGLGVSSRGTEAGRAASPTSTMNLILPVAGLALIGAGIVLALMTRNRGGNPTEAEDGAK